MGMEGFPLHSIPLKSEKGLKPPSLPSSRFPLGCLLFCNAHKLLAISQSNLNHHMGNGEREKNSPQLAYLVTFQLVGFTLCWQTLVCGDKGRRRKSWGEKMPSHFYSASRKGKVDFSNTCQVWSCPRAFTEPSFCSFYSLWLTFFHPIKYMPILVINSAHDTKELDGFSSR